MGRAARRGKRAKGLARPVPVGAFAAVPSAVNVLRR